MDNIQNRRGEFVGYDYTEENIDNNKVSLFLDGYENFGWSCESTGTNNRNPNKTVIKLKRDRHIINKAELTRLQRHFDACLDELSRLERESNALPTMAALIAGVIGTCFIAGSTFAVTNEPPIIWLCILLAIPGFIGWIAAYPVYRMLLKRQSERIKPLMEAKYDEIYKVCEKGHQLLY